MDSRRSRTSARWYLAAAAAVLILSTASILSFERLRPHATPRNTQPQGAAAKPSPPANASTQRNPLTQMPSQAALEALMAKTRHRQVFDMHLRRLEFKSKLGLTEAEHRLLLDDVVDFEHRRAQIEQSLVTVTSFDGNTLSLSIPPFPQQGLELKNELIGQIALDFPPDRAAQIAAAFEGRMEELFCGFGKFSQSMSVSTPYADKGMISVAYSAAIPSALESVDDDTLAELGSLSGNGGFGGDSLKYFFEGIAPVVETYFPGNPSKTILSTGVQNGIGQ
jgi:hypothetical protein